MAVINSKLIFSFILLSLLGLSACEEQVQKGDELSPEAREILRQRAAKRCISESNSDIEDFYENSNDKMLDLEREDTFEYKYSKGEETSYIYVWKVSPPNIYFRILLRNEGSTKNQFLKIDTTTNEEMVRNLQQKICAKDLDSKIGSSNMTINVEEPRINEDSETESESEIDYRVSSQYPAYFGAINRKKTKRYYDKDDDDRVTKTETFDYTIKRVADVDQPSTYSDSSIHNREYCVVKFTAATPLNEYDFPFTLECTNSDTAGPTGFDPAVELPL